ncbi:MAG: hypothetical protein ACXQTJ_04130, partial [Candidatus Syntropharchaeales archaeon]
MGELDSILHEIDIPFPHHYLNLALLLYESALKSSTMSVRFILFMSGMEALLSVGGVETNYSTSRNAAILLATPDDTAKEIFTKMMALFRKRGVLLLGQAEVKASRRIDEEDVEYIKSLLGRGIVRAHRLGLDKSA